MNKYERTPQITKDSLGSDKKDEPLTNSNVSKGAMPKSGSEIMMRFVQGDDDAFEELLCLFENAALNFFYKLTGKRHAAEDMTQELFIKVYRYRDSYTQQASFKSFLFRMARNLWIDRYRKMKVRPREVSIESKASDSQEGTSGLKGMMASQKPSPHEKALKNEQIKQLEACIKKLPIKQQEVLALTLDGEVKYAQAAEILKIPVGTVKSRVHSAILKLKELMGEV